MHKNDDTGRRPIIAVLGSVNLDLVATATRLPVAGETVTGARLARYPGGKGANQALAARRLGADVALTARVGNDAAAAEALALLRDEGVDLTACLADTRAPTGVALIVVSATGENQIVVAPGANAVFLPDSLETPQADALICQLEVPMDTIAKAADEFTGFFSLNLAPAAPVSARVLHRADLIVMNETEAEFVGDGIKGIPGLVATTYGADGAVLTRHGEEIARARPPKIKAVDTTGSGDVFTAALTLKLVDGTDPHGALVFACAAGAFAATRPGAQPSFPSAEEVRTLIDSG